MEGIISRIEAIDWKAVASSMHDKGYAIVPKVISGEQCNALIRLYDVPHGYRKTVHMERHRFGSGEYKYFDYPLPKVVQELREHLYPKLAPIANLWMQLLEIDSHFPGNFSDLQKQCHQNKQVEPTPLLLRYGKGGYNTLHQDLYGTVYFPLQCALFLNEPETDYQGGEFVLTQQTPRAQSRAIVLKPKKGDMLVFTTNFRPVKGKRAYYRANMKHGVSELLSGERHTLGIIFHDALR